MDKTTELVFLGLATVGFVAWLGGGRKWTFRVLLSALMLSVLGFVVVLLYGVWTESSAERQTKRIHACAVAKVANPKCEEDKKITGLLKGGVFTCPAYKIDVDKATSEQLNTAMYWAGQECRQEMGLTEKSLYGQINQYKTEHGSTDPFAATPDPAPTKLDPNKPDTGTVPPLPPGYILDPPTPTLLGIQDCAARVRKYYPGAYDNIDDFTLVRKVVKKYPTVCDSSVDLSRLTPVQ